MRKRITQLLLAGAMVAATPALAKADGYGRNLWSGFGVQVILAPPVIHRPPVVVHRPPVVVHHKPVVVHHKPVVVKHQHKHKHWHRPPGHRHVVHHQHRDGRRDWDRRDRRHHR